MRTAKFKYIFILYICSFFLAELATAATIKDLYDVEIPVHSQDRIERLLAIKQGLAEVLIRVSGRSDVVLSIPSLVSPIPDPLKAEKPAKDDTLPDLALVGSSPGITTALEQSARYAKLYRYQKPSGRPHMRWGVEWGLKQAGNNAKPTTQVLWLRFNEKKVNKLLRDNGLPVWGKTRPTVLIWLAYEQGGKRSLIANNSPATVRTELVSQAKLYGLPLRLPLMDLADHANIQVGDVWANFEGTILAASKRYQTEAVVVGRVAHQDNQWRARWTLYQGGRRLDWETAKPQLNDALALGVSQSSQTLAQAFAHVDVSSDAQAVIVKVKKVDGLGTYRRTTDYLSNLSGVSRVTTREITTESVTYTITMRGGRIALMQAISLGQKMAAEPNTTIISSPSDKTNTIAAVQPDLVYRLLK